MTGARRPLAAAATVAVGEGRFGGRIMRWLGRSGMRAAVMAGLFAATAAGAVPLTHLDDFRQLHGRYVPAGDCGRQPQIVVDRSGFGFEIGTIREHAATPEFAASYGGNYYQGISLWFFPWFGDDSPKPLLLVFNADEQPGVLVVEANDHDYPGGPALPARYRTLVQGSPYLRCE